MAVKEMIIDLLVDPHVRIENPDCITAKNDKIVVNCGRGQKRPNIFLEIPEILSSKNPLMFVRLGMNGGWNHFIVQTKTSKYGWVNIFDLVHVGVLPETTIVIELDPECSEYRLIPYDGGYAHEYITMGRSVKITYMVEELLEESWLPLALVASGVAFAVGVGVGYFVR